MKLFRILHDSYLPALRLLDGVEATYVSNIERMIVQGDGQFRDKVNQELARPALGRDLKHEALHIEA